MFELKHVEGQDVIETTQKMFVEAHDGDILSLSFNQQNTLLASASRYATPDAAFSPANPNNVAEIA